MRQPWRPAPSRMYFTGPREHEKAYTVNQISLLNLLAVRWPHHKKIACSTIVRDLFHFCTSFTRNRHFYTRYLFIPFFSFHLFAKKDVEKSRKKIRVRTAPRLPPVASILLQEIRFYCILLHYNIFLYARWAGCCI